MLLYACGPLFQVNFVLVANLETSSTKKNQNQKLGDQGKNRQK